MTLLINYILYSAALFNAFTRRNIINLGLSNIVMNKNVIRNCENYDNWNKNFTSKYDLNIDYKKVPELDSDSNTKTIIHIEDNNIFFQGEVTTESCFYLQQNLLKLQKDHNENKYINFYIQSFGGSLLSSFSVVDTIKSSNIPVYTYINGYVASAASLISVVGHKRFMSKNSMMLIHSLRTSIGDVNYQQLEDHYFNSMSMMNIVKNIYKEKAIIDDEHLDFLLSHDYWLNSTECLKYKFVDYII